MSAKKRTLKPETVNMRGAAERSLRSAFSQYQDWQRAQAEDLSDRLHGDPAHNFVDWATDLLDDG